MILQSKAPQERPAEGVSDTTVLSESDGPAFDTTIEYTVVVPATSVDRPFVLVMLRSAGRATVLEAVAIRVELIKGLSACVVVNAATLLNVFVAVDATVALIVNVRVLPAGKLLTTNGKVGPEGQITPPFAMQFMVPRVAPELITSVIVTLDAANEEGPLLFAKVTVKLIIPPLVTTDGPLLVTVKLGPDGSTSTYVIALLTPESRRSSINEVEDVAAIPSEMV